ncbi:hypothetical protein M427DRAFT_73388 [Gonapodya prolifera JEL478]|uniref:Uncharacterized protein n=1 Tax=Gonapodya prolifera (strain JEL478) TaxID=1344416 RepID=A0A139A2A0_GONPJ|nr:hypothetical protein M427DRAFT_73388 [Gonapodya prolifera JEL478]|eukprot:KXS10920.1 hypothetical protein M427DRAFT_73388 [Gonapodya prolifera JEL478]
MTPSSTPPIPFAPLTLSPRVRLRRARERRNAPRGSVKTGREGVELLGSGAEKVVRTKYVSFRAKGDLAARTEIEMESKAISEMKVDTQKCIVEKNAAEWILKYERESASHISNIAQDLARVLGLAQTTLPVSKAAATPTTSLGTFLNKSTMSSSRNQAIRRHLFL